MTKKTHITVGAAATIPDIDLSLGIKHRTITHGFISLILSTLVLSLVNIPISLVWGLNYAIHLILDSFTKTGVPLFYPYNKKYYGMKLICTGQSEDLFICLIAILVICSCLGLT